MFRILFFILASGFFVKISWRSLHNPRCHGFYRFFVFEGVLILLLLIAPYRFHDPLSVRQAVSLVLLCGSLFCVIQGVRQLKKKGGRRPDGTHPENLAFENTARLVTDGIFARIRHPMYTSLLLLAWGLFLKHTALPSLVAAAATTCCVLVAARMEERENVAFFGHRYQAYMRRTYRFIPYVY